MKKHKLIRFFLLSFIGWLVVFITGAKFGLSREMGPHNWQEIYDNVHVYLLMAFGGAIFLTLGYFVNKYGKEEK